MFIFQEGNPDAISQCLPASIVDIQGANTSSVYEVQKDELLKAATGAIHVLSNSVKERTDNRNENTKSKYFSFMTYVANKMETMSEQVTDEVEEKIMAIFFEGSRKSKGCL